MKSMIVLLMNAINFNVAVVENVAEMESVDGSATSGGL